jgi:hypothetical protein
MNSSAGAESSRASQPRRRPRRASFDGLGEHWGEAVARASARLVARLGGPNARVAAGLTVLADLAAVAAASTSTTTIAVTVFLRAAHGSEQHQRHPCPRLFAHRRSLARQLAGAQRNTLLRRAAWKPRSRAHGPSSTGVGPVPQSGLTAEPHMLPLIPSVTSPTPIAGAPAVLRPRFPDLLRTHSRWLSRSPQASPVALTQRGTAAPKEASVHMPFTRARGLRVETLSENATSAFALATR